MSKTTQKILRDYGIAVAAAVAIALFLRFFVVEAYRIPTPAMRPTLEPGDTIFVLKAPLGFDRTQISRGDVVIFESPSDPGREYVKRVVALAGDTVQIKKGRTFLNGKALTVASTNLNSPCGEELLPERPKSFSVCWEQPLLEDFGPEKIPSGSVFVVGDFRTQSPTDTKKRRSWGIVPLPLVKGRAHWIWLSIEPHHSGVSPARFPNFRFDRMLRRIE